MSVAKQRRALARVSFHTDHVSELIRVRTEPVPWAARQYDDDQVFRGRLLPGTAVLPAGVASSGAHGIILGLSSRPIVLRSVGVAHHIPANVPWVVLADAEWRITATEPTDLRLVNSHEFAPGLVARAVSASRPTRFEGPQIKIVRAAIKSATPEWIDPSDEPVKDLAVSATLELRLVGSRTPAGTYDRDQTNAFVLMMSWALEQLTGDQDPRFAAIAQYIKARIGDPNLNTDAIADQLRISRRTLQTLFETDGGVAGYIRRLRLAAVLQLITRDADQVPDLEAVAEMTGLGSRRTLERAMRQVYGLTPRQARSHVLAGNLLRERTSNERETS